MTAFVATARADTFNGGSGEDSVSYENISSGLNIFMIPSADATGAAVGDIFFSIENVYGTHYGDFIHGDSNNNTLYGLGGNDSFYGAGGSDRLYGGDGTDNLVSGSGADYIDGGNGIDTLSYQLSDSAVTVSMMDPRINTGWAAGDTYTNVEDLTGTNYDDVIYGDGQAVNNLWGLAGNDRIYGGAGYDVMIGDAGADYLDGGEGTDLADYETAKSAVVASLADPSINTGNAAGDVYVSIEDIAGSAYNDILYGNAQGNGMNGWPGDDVMYGGAGGDGLDGAEGNDVLFGGDDWDLIVGGTGIDTAGFLGPIANYQIKKAFDPQFGSDYKVVATVSNEGTDSLKEVERVKYSDMAVNLTVQQAAAGISPANLKLLEELYVAFFNRVPDADGLEYWIGQFKAGMSISQIADAFYAAGVQYPELTGYSPAMSNAGFVNVVYKNVLGRKDGADQEGLDYWSGRLDSGVATKGALVQAILGSAHTFKGDATWGWVADLLDNKAAVADTFAVDMGLNYLSSQESISKGIQIAAAVTPTDTSAAIALIGVNPGNIDLV